MPILRHKSKNPEANTAASSPPEFRPSAQTNGNKAGCADGIHAGGRSPAVAHELRAFFDAEVGTDSFENEIHDLLGRCLPVGFAVVRVKMTGQLPPTFRGAGRLEMVRRIRLGMKTLSYLDAHPDVGVSWRIYWILAELEDLGVVLRWTSPHVPFLE